MNRLPPLLLLTVLQLSSLGTPFAYAQTASPSAEPGEIATDSALPLPTPTLPPLPADMQLTVSPSILNLKTTPGTPVTATVKIKNNGTGAEALQIDLAKFSAGSNTGRPLLQDLGPQDQFPNWLTFSEKQFVVQPGEWHSVDITFSPPETAALGYYFAVIFNRQQKADAAPRSTVVTGAPAILTLVNVKSGQEAPELALAEFRTDKRIYEFLPINFTVSLINIGNIHLAPYGNIFIDQGSNSDIAILNLNESGGFVLPQSTREFSATWNDGFPHFVVKEENGQMILDEQGKQQQKLEWNFQNLNRLRFGKYTANLLFVYDNGERDVPLESQLEFWVIPWRLIAVALAILIFFLIGFSGTIKKIFGLFKRKPKDTQPDK